MCENEVKAGAPKITNDTVAETSFQDSQSYQNILFSEWRRIGSSENESMM